MSTPTSAPVGPAPQRPAPANAANTRRVIILTTVGLVVLVLIGVLLLLPTDDGTTPAAATPAATAEVTPDPAESTQPTEPVEELSPEEAQAQRDALFASLVRRDADDPTALGAVDAPVVMIMWADFRCGYCAQFAVQTEPGLADLVADGTLRIEWRDYPVITEESPEIAAAARAAALQGKFWEYHDRLFADHSAVPAMDDAYLSSVAADLGLDVAKFDADRASDEVQALVEADAQEAAGIGVRSTPTFLINGSAVMGSQPLDAYRQVIEAELARVSG